MEKKKSDIFSDKIKFGNIIGKSAKTYFFVLDVPRTHMSRIRLKILKLD